VDKPSDSDDGAEPVNEQRVPKYRASDFMRNEIALFHRARIDMQSVLRNGDNDAPIRPIAAVRAVRAIRPVRLRSGEINFEA
jgi:hypothetical protein